MHFARINVKIGSSTAKEAAGLTLGEKIRSARIERGLTQKQLVGDYITRNMLSKIENDSATPSVKTLEYLAAKLDLPAGYFMADARYSDGTSPDGLDDMRKAYREGRYLDCISLLEAAKDVGTTDEGYLLHARANLAAAHESLAAGDMNQAKNFADAADYYNRQSIYYSPAVDAEMSLILAECALDLDVSEFEKNAAEYERAVTKISFSARYQLARTEYLLKSGESELAGMLLSSLQSLPESMRTKYLCLYGQYQMAIGSVNEAIETLLKAEELLDEDPVLARKIYSSLEQCYSSLEDYKMAYVYASKQLR